MKAKVYLVGAGSGDADLLTRKAHRLLQQAHVIIYDRLVSKEVLALANPFAILFYAGERKGEQDEVQAEIYRAFLQYTKDNKSVVRLKSGDPSLFGRCGEELAFLNDHGIEAEVVPGISSALAAPALNGIPLTLRKIATSFIVMAVLILMGVESRASIAQRLMDAGRSSQEAVAFTENVSTPRERLVESNLSEIRDGRCDVRSPAVMVLGIVVRCRAEVFRRELSLQGKEAIAC